MNILILSLLYTLALIGCVQAGGSRREDRLGRPKGCHPRLAKDKGCDIAGELSTGGLAASVQQVGSTGGLAAAVQQVGPQTDFGQN
jgi:hypothetical protein